MSHDVPAKNNNMSSLFSPSTSRLVARHSPAPPVPPPAGTPEHVMPNQPSLDAVEMTTTTTPAASAHADRRRVLLAALLDAFRLAY
jgi:hypothetical protein